MKWNILVGSLVLGLGLSTQSFGLDLLDRMLGMNYNGGCDTASCCDTKCDPGPSCGCDTGCDVQGVPCAPRCRRTPLLDLLRNIKCRCQQAGCGGGCSDPCADPGCGCEVDPGCGCEVDPGCGCEVDPGCGSEQVCAPKKCRRTPLLNLLRSFQCKAKKSCCDNGCADPGCGVEPSCGCDPGCGVEAANGCEAKCVVKKRCRTSLLDRIFTKRCARKSCCDNGCADPGCGVEPSCGCDPGCGYESGNGNGAPEEAPTEADADEVGPAPVVDPSAFLPTQRRFIQTNLVR